MIKRFIYCIISISFLSISFLKAQDPHFSQYYANPLYLNPAFAGTVNCPRVIFNHRNQWPSISGNYVTYNVSYDQHIDALNGGIGVIVTTDKAGQGVLSKDIIGLMYSYRLDVSRNFSIKAGFQATYFQNRIDWEKLTFGDMIDPKYGFVYNTNEIKPEPRKGSADFSAGFLGYSENFYIGAAVHHLTEPDAAFYGVSKLPRKYTGHVGGVINLKGGSRPELEDPILSPNILFMKQQDFEQLNYGLYFSRYPVVGGIWYRQSFQNSDAVIALVGLQTGILKVGYSYDVTISKLTNASGGAHEISFAYHFPCIPKKRKIRTINCPSF
ncbi:MAG: type IX secretion system membrane protein PorP/SprF [Bacteroidales bacterium]|nr:type IX secretion system membrane protein PorP/SprF [Bacteroidales bacterium]